MKAIIFLLTINMFLCLNNWVPYKKSINRIPFNNNYDTIKISLSKDVMPILKTKCISCHGKMTASKGINLSEYSGIISVVKDERLIRSIKHIYGVSPMPRFGNRLKNADISIISAWIKQGAINN